MTCLPLHCINLLLVLGSPAEPTSPTTPGALAGPEPELVERMLEDADPMVRSARKYEQATVFAEEGEYDEALRLSLESYRLLPEATRYSDSGLFVIFAAVEHYDSAQRRSKDDARAALIQSPLEELIERYQGLDPRVDQLARKLEGIRKERLGLSERYVRERKFSAAATEARDCYLALQNADKGRAIGEQAVIAASQAYRQAWYGDGDIRHLKGALELLSDHMGRAGSHASPSVKRERARLERSLATALASGGGISDENDAVIAPQERSFLFASGAALGGGAALSIGAAAVGAYGFDFELLPATNGVRSIRAEPDHVATAVSLGVVGGVVTGLAIHSMIDTGLIPPRERKILAVSATTMGLLGTLLGSVLLTVGSQAERDLAHERARRAQNAGFGILVGMGAPLGAGIAALVSRRAGGR